ncbi:MAG: phage major capsid protein [Burkholderiales bacterium]
MRDLTPIRLARAQFARATLAKEHGEALPEALRGFIAKQRHWASFDRELIEDVVAKAGVGSSDLSDAVRAASSETWAPPLPTNSVLDQLLRLGATRAEPYVRAMANGNQTYAVWRTGGGAIRPSKADFQGAVLTPFTIGALLAASRQSLEDASALTEAQIQAEGVATLDAEINRSMTDPENTGSDAEPASLTSVATPIHSSGSAIANIVTDTNALQREIIDIGSDGKNLAYFMTPRTSSHMSAIRGTNGEIPFPAITPSGGFLNGIPVIVSSAIPNDGSPTSTSIALIDVSDVVIVDNGPRIVYSGEAAFEAADNPTGDATTPTGMTNFVLSAFQEDMVLLRCTRRANWGLKRGFVVVCDGVAY